MIAPDSELKLNLAFGNIRNFNCSLNLEWQLPEGWYFEGSNTQTIMSYGTNTRTIGVKLHVGKFKRAFEYVPLKLMFAERNYPTFLAIPFQCSGMAAANGEKTLQEAWDTKNRITARLKAIEHR